VRKDSAQIRGADHQTVGVLEEYGMPAVAQPVGRSLPGPQVSGGLAAGLEPGQHLKVRLAALAAQGLGRQVNRFDIPDYMVQRTPGEPGIFVGRTKRAAVPGAVAGYPEQEAPGFAGRANGPLFEAAIRFLIYQCGPFFRREFGSRRDIFTTPTLTLLLKEEGISQ
jgi:hypothetical protein